MRPVRWFPLLAWRCPDCAWTNHVRGEDPERADEEIQADGPEGADGYVMDAPERVNCDHCGSLFRLEPPEGE